MITAWFTRKKAWRLALIVRADQPCDAVYNTTGGPGVPTPAPSSPAATPAPRAQPRPGRRAGQRPSHSSATTASSTSPINRVRVLAGNAASTHTPSGVPSTEPSSSAGRPAGSKSRRSGTKMTIVASTVYTVSSTIAATGDITSGRKASATRPLPKPASTRTKNAPAMTTAPRTQSRLTRGAPRRRRECTARASGGARHGQVRRLGQRVRQGVRGDGGRQAPRVRQLRVRHPPAGAGVRTLWLQGGRPRRGGAWRVLLLRQLRAHGRRAGTPRPRRLRLSRARAGIPWRPCSG